MIQWHETKREYTVWLETSVLGFEIWLEWNDRVSAYRFGFLTPVNASGERFPSQSWLGFCDDLETAQALALEKVIKHATDDTRG